MKFFSRDKKGRDDKNGDNGGGAVADAKVTFKRDPRKANKFFKHAEATADSRQYEYSIECYVSGLRHDPDNMVRHEELHEVAIKRKIAGGKPAGIKEKLKSSGKDPLSKLTHAEKMWAYDPFNVKAMRAAMELAAEANGALDDVDLGELVYWIGNKVLDFNAGAKKPDKATYLKARDLFVQMGAFDRAVQACGLAFQMDPDNSELEQQLKDLEAERTISEGGYADTKTGSRGMVRDMATQRALAEDAAISKTESTLDSIIDRRRSEWQETPADYALLGKLVDSLREKGTVESEADAIQLLEKAYQDTQQYSYRAQIGDIKMRQLNRHLRELKEQCEADPEDQALKQKHADAAREVLLVETEEYADRVKNYPTDLKMKFEYGRRLFLARQFDEAIGAFQQAKNDPKVRSASHEYLGRAYVEQNWFEEAIDTLRQGIEAHPLNDDKLGMDLRYYLMDALERLAIKEKSVALAKESQKVASQILQTDISYRDIRQRMDKIRALVDKLQKNGG